MGYEGDRGELTNSPGKVNKKLKKFHLNKSLKDEPFSENKSSLNNTALPSITGLPSILPSIGKKPYMPEDINIIEDDENDYDCDMSIIGSIRPPTSNTFIDSTQ